MADEQADPLAWLRAPLLYHAPGMDDVTPRSVAYRRTPEGDLPMDIYPPLDLPPGERRPAVMFIHGGPIPPELPPATEWGVYRGYGALAAASGWVGVTFKHRFHSYRQDSDYDQLEQAESDIAAATAYVREHADELSVDADQICLWAFSGGGSFLARPLRERPTYVRCLIAYYAVMDLRPMPSGEERTGDGAAMTRLARFSPAATVEEGGATTPVLVARAGRDHPLLNAGIDRFIQAALAANMPLDVLNHPSGHHGFDARDDDARTREIIRHTLDFARALRAVDAWSPRPTQLGGGA
ncbi:MAG TPA: alpha/beta hydrolase [Ktedonobacterales bacterium]|nr:alpha/beta hydrolase [Ktedonobacterales bacterium]